MVTSSAILDRSRSDLPRNEWPGTPVVENSKAIVEQACGDRRELFTFEERLHAHYAIEKEHFANWKRGHRPDYQFKLILLIGKKGQGKSLVATYHLAQLYRSGIPVFHNGGLLFGNVLDLVEMYTAINDYPVGCATYFDEFHTVNQTSRELASSQVLQNESWAALRKQDIFAILATSMPGMIGKRARSAVDQIWMPEKLEVIRAKEENSSQGKPWDYNAGRGYAGQRYVNERAADDPANFQYRMLSTTDNPWKDTTIESVFYPDNERERKQRKTQGLDYEIYEKILKPSWVREAMKLTDSFMPVRIGAAMMVDQKMVKAKLRGQDVDSANRDELLESLIVNLWNAFESGELEKEGRVRAAKLCAVSKLDITSQRMGQYMSNKLGIPSGENRSGYDLADIYQLLDRIMATPSDAENATLAGIT